MSRRTNAEKMCDELEDVELYGDIIDPQSLVIFGRWGEETGTRWGKIHRLLCALIVDPLEAEDVVETIFPADVPHALHDFGAGEHGAILRANALEVLRRYVTQDKEQEDHRRLRDVGVFDPRLLSWMMLCALEPMVNAMESGEKEELSRFLQMVKSWDKHAVLALGERAGELIDEAQGLSASAQDIADNVARSERARWVAEARLVEWVTEVAVAVRHTARWWNHRSDPSIWEDFDGPDLQEMVTAERYFNGTKFVYSARQARLARESLLQRLGDGALSFPERE